MASSKSSQNKPAPELPRYRPHSPRPPSGTPEIVDPIWLLKAIGLLIVAALICGYGTLCLLLYQGQWQLLFHPAQTTSHPADLAGSPVKFFRFGPDESGVPQRTGWFLVASPGAHYSRLTILLLPSGDGSLVDDAATLTALHEVGINVFGIDYRGFGESAAIHPNEQRMTQDVASAWQFLTSSRGVQGEDLIPYGVGFGTSLAVRLAADHPVIRAIILDSPAQDPLLTLQRDPRTRLLPVHLLLHEQFALAEPLRSLSVAKLLLSRAHTDGAFLAAAPPKLSVSLGEPRSPQQFRESLTRFLDSYAAGTPASSAPAMK